MLPVHDVSAWQRLFGSCSRMGFFPGPPIAAITRDNS